MSKGNDALPPKDAASDAPGTGTTSTSSGTGTSASGVPGSSTSSAASREESPAKSDVASDSSESSKSNEDASESSDAPSSERANSGKSSESDAESDDKMQARSGRRSGSSPARRHVREDDDEDRELPPQTEEALDVPKMHTIYMLAAMSVLTVVLWFAAKLTCNVHPDQVREPKHFSTKDLAADPKNAAFEFHQKFEMADYITAFDLATGEMKRVVEAKLKECEQKADECVETQKKLADKVESVGKVLDRTETRATVELTTVYKGNPGSKSFVFDVVKDGQFWRVASRRETAAAPAQQMPNNAAPNAASPAAPVEVPDPPAAQ